MLHHFNKLQDALGERLIPATLGWLREPHESWPMRDRLDWLDWPGHLQVADRLAWRDIRHRLVHDYPGETDRRHAAVDAAAALLAADPSWKRMLPGRPGLGRYMRGTAASSVRV